MLTICSHFGLLDPKHKTRTRGWRRLGTAIVRWPGPILAVACALALIGLLALPGYKTSYDARPYLPASAPANVGYTAAERHFSQARLNPELLMIETDHDMRNPADMLILERVAKAILHTPGIALVQSITRPLGTPHLPQLHSVSDQRLQRQPDHEPALPAGPRPGSAEAGRRDLQHDRHPEATVGAAAGQRRGHPAAEPKPSTTPSRP